MLAPIASATTAVAHNCVFIVKYTFLLSVNLRKICQCLIERLRRLGTRAITRHLVSPSIFVLSLEWTTRKFLVGIQQEQRIDCTSLWLRSTGLRVTRDLLPLGFPWRSITVLLTRLKGTILAPGILNSVFHSRI